MGDNYVEDFPGGLIPSVYSKKKFIEFIKKYLDYQSSVIPKYLFKAGSNMAVDVIDAGVDKKQVTYSYFSSTPPTASVVVTPSTAEFGQKFQPGGININTTVNRKTYPLKSITWTSGINPTISETLLTLENIIDGGLYNKISTNSIILNGSDTAVAAGGAYIDTTDTGGSLQAAISRTTRHFWGNISGQDAIFNPRGPLMDSILGSIPQFIDVDHGATPSYMVIATTSTIKVFVNGVPIDMLKRVENISSYSADMSYVKQYNIYIAYYKSTGPFTYEIR